jgi:uncharacterized protein (TIGR03435 family)
VNFRKVIVFVAAGWMCLSDPPIISQTIEAPGSTLAVEKSLAGSHSLTFDVVSIRPHKAGALTGAAGDITQDEYRAVGWPLWYTIGMAYFPRVFVHRNRFVGLPDWAWNDKYDFVAKVSPNDVQEWQKLGDNIAYKVRNHMLEAMLQAAFAERCKLVVHHVKTTVPGFALVLDKHGPNWKTLKVTNPDAEIPSIAQKLAYGGLIVPILPGAEPVVTYYKTSMASLADDLSGMTLVEDRTGLTGQYDFKLTRWDTDLDPPRIWDLGALGLKLEPIQVPAESLVIDHIERPSPN